MNYLILITPIISIICAAVLAYHGISGWGWFLFIAVITSGTDLVKTVNNKKTK